MSAWVLERVTCNETEILFIIKTYIMGLNNMVVVK